MVGPTHVTQRGEWVDSFSLASYCELEFVEKPEGNLFSECQSFLHHETGPLNHHILRIQSKAIVYFVKF